MREEIEKFKEYLKGLDEDDAREIISFIDSEASEEFKNATEQYLFEARVNATKEKINIIQKKAHKAFDKVPNNVKDFKEKHHHDALIGLMHDGGACKLSFNLLQDIINNNNDNILHKMAKLSARIDALEEKIDKDE